MDSSPDSTLATTQGRSGAGNRQAVAKRLPSPKRQPSPRNARKNLSPDQLMEKLEQLEKYKVEEDKVKKKDDMQRKKDMAAAKKKLAREIQGMRGTVKKAGMVVGKLQSQIKKVETKQADSVSKKIAMTGKFEDQIQKAEEKHHATEAEMQQKIGEVGAAKGTLAYLEYAQQMLEKGILLSRDPKAELEAAEMGRLRAIAGASGNMEDADAFDFAAMQAGGLDSSGASEWQDDMLTLREELTAMRDENSVLRQRLDLASGTVKVQDDRIETLKNRLQEATETMKQKVEKIEELTEGVSMTQTLSGPTIAQQPPVIYPQPVASQVLLGDMVLSPGSTGFQVVSPGLAGLQGTMSPATERSHAGSGRFPAEDQPAEISNVFSEMSTSMRPVTPTVLSSQALPHFVSAGYGPTISPMGSAGVVTAQQVFDLSASGRSPVYQTSGGSGRFTPNNPVQDDIFDRMDTDHNGTLSRAEFKKAVKSGLLMPGALTGTTTPVREQQFAGYAMEGLSSASNGALRQGEPAMAAATPRTLFTPAAPSTSFVPTRGRAAGAAPIPALSTTYAGAAQPGMALTQSTRSVSAPRPARGVSPAPYSAQSAYATYQQMSQQQFEPMSQQQFVAANAGFSSRPTSVVRNSNTPGAPSAYHPGAVSSSYTAPAPGNATVPAAPVRLPGRPGTNGAAISPVSPYGVRTPGVPGTSPQYVAGYGSASLPIPSSNGDLGRFASPAPGRPMQAYSNAPYVETIAPQAAQAPTPANRIVAAPTVASAIMHSSGPARSAPTDASSAFPTGAVVSMPRAGSTSLPIGTATYMPGPVARGSVASVAGATRGSVARGSVASAAGTTAGSSSLPIGNAESAASSTLTLAPQAFVPQAESAGAEPGGRGFGFQDAVHKVTANALREYRANHRGSVDAAVNREHRANTFA